jgi:methylamine dehydrogenase accessory protein MauD
MKKNNVFWWVFLVGLALFAICFCLGGLVAAGGLTGYLSNRTTTTTNSDNSLIGSTAPDFSLPTLDGQTVRLSSLRGQPVMLTFSTTWCPDCQKLDPVLQSLYEDDNGVVVLVVDSGEDERTVRDFVNGHNYTYTIALDTSSKVSHTYGVWAIPVTYFIDAQGIIQAVRLDAMSKSQTKEYLEQIGVNP